MTGYGSGLTAGYTGDGLRAWKQNSSARTYFLYDGIVPIVEMDSNGALTATNSFGASGLVSRRTVSSVFYSFDAGGSVAQRTDASGSALSNYVFSAYGSVVSGSVSEPFGYKAQFGYYTDNETGLQLLTHRYYDPNAGRFLTRDPSQYSGGINLYGYVTNDPINLLDPLGLDGWGSELADWLDARIDYAQRFWQYGDQEWVANGINTSVADVARGAADVLRVGSGTGHAMYDPDDNGYGRAAGVAQDIARAAAIFNLVGGGASKFAAGPTTGSCANTNPFTGPVGRSVTVVGPKGDAIRLMPGEQLTGSPNGAWLQVRDAGGRPTGVRLDGPHRPSTHPDLRAQRPHAHIPGLRNSDGTPWLPSR